MHEINFSYDELVNSNYTLVPVQEFLLRSRVRIFGISLFTCNMHM